MWQIIELDSVDSTSNYIKARQGEFVVKTAVLAAEQTAGRGRLGRSFHSVKGGMYLSAWLPLGIPTERAVSLTPAAAVAARRAILRFGVDAGIKWVNDLLVGGKKLCGILVEPTVRDGVVQSAVFGIGINIEQVADDFASELRDICTSLKQCGAERMPSARTLAEAVLDELDAVLAMDVAALRDEYALHCVTVGRGVEVVKPDGGDCSHAVALGVGDAFELLVEDGDGRQFGVTSISSMR